MAMETGETPLEGRIVQIVPARGWRAMYMDEDAPPRQRVPEGETVAVWALVEQADGPQHLVGFTGGQGGLRPAPSRQYVFGSLPSTGAEEAEP
jgi:hypothetical protein